MSDWRLELNGYMVEDLVGATFYKVTFPEFWKVAYREKNAFYQDIERYANLMLKTLIKDTNTLKVKKYNIFGTSIVTCATKKQ